MQIIFTNSFRLNFVRPANVLTAFSSKVASYSGREAPTLKMGSVCFPHFFFFEGLTSGLLLIGSWPDDTFFVVSRTVLE